MGNVASPQVSIVQRRTAFSFVCDDDDDDDVDIDGADAGAVNGGSE